MPGLYVWDIQIVQLYFVTEAYKWSDRLEYLTEKEKIKQNGGNILVFTWV